MVVYTLFEVRLEVVSVAFDVAGDLCCEIERRVVIGDARLERNAERRMTGLMRLATIYRVLGEPVFVAAVRRISKVVLGSNSVRIFTPVSQF